MPIEFLGMAATNDRSETRARSGPVIDKEYALRLARAHEDNGWDRVLFGYSSASPDGDQVAAYVAAHTSRLNLLLAHRPGVTLPTHTARTLATLDQLGDGRLTVHIITGGNDTERCREGDYLTYDERYERTGEYIQILKRAWTSREPISHEGQHYRFADFHSDVRPVSKIGISFGGSSPAAYTPETVAQALLDYVDLGVDILSMRGYDTLDDAVDVGRYVIPIVREKVAKRDRERETLASTR
jgi:alkanesulfonate monooxygenase